MSFLVSRKGAGEGGSGFRSLPGHLEHKPQAASPCRRAFSNPGRPTSRSAEVDCFPLVRPGLSLYSGHKGMAQLVKDMHTVHGNYQVSIEKITEDPGPQITVESTITPEPGYGPPLSVATLFTFHEGLIYLIQSKPVPGTW